MSPSQRARNENQRTALLQSAVAKLFQPNPEDHRPTLLFIAGPNGAGKTTWFNMRELGLAGQFVLINPDIMASLLSSVANADVLAQKFGDVWRDHMLGQKQSFATETVFSDPEGVKLDYLKAAANLGFRVIVVYITLDSAATSRDRVDFRVASKMGHAVEHGKLPSRMARSMRNAQEALGFVEIGIVLDNSDPRPSHSFRPLAVTYQGNTIYNAPLVPPYAAALLPPVSVAARKKFVAFHTNHQEDE